MTAEVQEVQCRDQPKSGVSAFVRGIQWVLWGMFIVGILIFVWLLSDSTRARHGFFELQRLSEVDVLYGNPSDHPAAWGGDSPEALAPFRDEATAMAGTGTTFERATRLMNRVAELGNGSGIEAMATLDPIENDDPTFVYSALRDGVQRGNCAHYSWAYMLMAGAARIEARVVGMEGEKWVDGDGHALVEIFNPELEGWALIDPQHNAYMVDSQGKPLSLLEVRAALRSSPRGDLEVVQGGFNAAQREPSQIVKYYAGQVDRLVYEPQRSVLVGYTRIYESWPARLVALDVWPRPMRRVLENLIWQRDSRLLYVDSPEVDFFFVERWAFLAAKALVLISLPLIAIFAFSRRQLGR